MDHTTHEAGTEPECLHCRAVTYEPGWYAMLQRLSQTVEEAEANFFPAPPPVFPTNESPAPVLTIPPAPIPSLA